LPASIELSDDQLDAAAGGSGVIITMNDHGNFSIIT
jgi:hypothetical protein